MRTITRTLASYVLLVALALSTVLAAPGQNVLFYGANQVAAPTGPGVKQVSAVGQCVECNTLTTTLTGVTAHHALVVHWGGNGAIGGNVPSDSLNGAVFTQVIGANNNYHNLAVFCDTAAGDDTFTVIGANGWAFIEAVETQGNHTTGCVDASGAALGTDSNTTQSANSSAVAHAVELVLGFLTVGVNANVTGVTAGAASTLLTPGTNVSVYATVASEKKDVTSGLSGAQTVGFGYTPAGTVNHYVNVVTIY